MATIGSWIPLTAGVPTQAMARRMAEVLASPAWQTPLPVPTVDRTDKRWKSDAFWRGDVWPPTNYQIASGLAAYGHKDLAADIADKTIANAIKNGISEHYDSVSGKPLGVRDYCMSCTLVTMMLDGLDAKAQVEAARQETCRQRTLVALPEQVPKELVPPCLRAARTGRRLNRPVQLSLVESGAFGGCLLYASALRPGPAFA